MADRRLLLAEEWVAGQRLGRNINHDGRSVAYRVGRAAKPTSAAWERRIPILDQGNLGSCTGNATVGCLGSEPFYSVESPAQEQGLDEALAVAIYSDATKIDDAPGTYPPTDTGSDGLSVAKVARTRGYISGYQHVMSLEEAYAAILDGPFIFGGLWMSGMDTPTSEGIVTPTGHARGGHEWLAREYDAARDLWKCDNSWSDLWGLNGSFLFDSAAMQWLLGQQGDATTFVPITQPAPVPAPPAPAPTPADFPLPQVQPWLDHLYTWSHIERNAKNAIKGWLNDG